MSYNADDPSGVREQLRRLEEARLQPRNPHACDQCSKAHRKCSYTQRHDVCDNCLRGNRACSSVPRVSSSSNTEDADRSGVLAGGSTYPANMRAQTQRQSNSRYPVGVPEGAYAQGRSAYPTGNQTYPQSSPMYSQYHNQAAAAHAVRGVDNSFSAPQTYPSTAYASDGSVARQDSGSRASAGQMRGQNDYYASTMSGQAQPLSPSYTGGGAQWGDYDTRAQQHHVPRAPPTAGPAYTTQSAMYPGAEIPTIQSQASAPTAQVRQSYTAHSPIVAQGRDYYVAGEQMYQIQQDGGEQTVVHDYSTSTGYATGDQMGPDTASDEDAYTRQHRGQ